MIPHIARIYLGFIDGSNFSEWYDQNDYEIKNVIGWHNLPDTSTLPQPPKDKDNG